MKLSERALLVSLHIGNWSATKHDKSVTEEVSENHRANKDAGKYNKQLVSRMSLKEIYRISAVARQTHYALSLPWEDDGARIITTRAYQDYANTMRILGIKYNKVVKEFLKAYPEEVKESQPRLGTMFNSEDYPPVSELRNKFYFEVEPKAITESSDFRAKVSNESAKAIIEDIESRSKERLDRAMNNVWERIIEVTTKMIDRMKSYNEANPANKRKGSFRDSLTDNIKELAELLPSLNINDDPKLDEIQKKLLADLCVHSTDDLRKDSKLRATTSKKAKDILKKVNDYLA